jgi:hypothetical protein
MMGVENSGMIRPLSTQGGHSARVNLRLLVNGLSLPVAQLGPDFLLVNAPVNHAPAPATVVMQVDETERRWNVQLPVGMTAGCKRVPIAAA